MQKLIRKILIITIIFSASLSYGSMNQMLDGNLSQALNKMEQLYASGKWDEAMELGRGIMKDAPRNHAVSNRAQDLIILSMDGKNQEILENKKRARVMKNQEAAQSLSAEGNGLLKQKNYKAASEKFKEAVKLGGGDAQTYFLLGYSSLKAKDKKQAYSAFKRCLQLDSKHAQALFHVAGLSFEFNRGSEAEGYATELIKLIESKLLEYRSIFQSQKAGKLNDMAVETAKKMASLKENLAQAAYMKGVLAEKRSDYDAAVAAFDKVVKLKPGYAEAWLRLGAGYLQRKMYHQATLSLEQAVFIREALVKEMSSESKRLLDEGLADEAVNAELKLRKVKEELAYSFYALSVANGRKKESGEALKNIEKSLKVKPDFIKGRYTKAILLAENNLLDEALDEMQGVLKECKPNSAEAKKAVQAITSLMNQIARRDNPLDMPVKAVDPRVVWVDKKLKDVAGTGSKATEEKMEELFPKLREIKKLVEMRNFAMASRNLVYLRAKHPEVAELHAMLAHCYMEMGRVGEAEKAFKQALDLQPRHPESLNGLAYIWATRGEHLQLAYEYIEQAVAKEGMRAEFWHTHGWVLFKQGELRRSIESYKKALGIKPNHMLARYNLGMSFYLVKGYGAAVDAFDAVLALNPTHQKALLFKAICLARVQNSSEALGTLRVLKETLDEKSTLAKVVADFEKKIQVADEKNVELPVPEIKSPAPIERLLAEAKDYRNKNLVTRAKEIYLECQRLAPDRYEPYDELAKMYAESGLNKAALSTWEQALALNPTSIDIRMNMGKMFHKIGSLESSKTVFKQIVDAEPKNAEAIYYLGMLSYEEKNFETARVYAQDALAIAPSFYKAMALRGMALVRLDKLKEAKAVYEGLYEKAPNNSSIKKHARVKIWEIARAIQPKQFPSYENAMQIKEELDKKVSGADEGGALPRIEIATSLKEEDLIAGYGKNTMTANDKEWVLRQLDRFGAIKNPTLSGTIRRDVTPQTLSSSEKQWVVNKLQSFSTQGSKYSLPEEVKDDAYSLKGLEDVVVKVADRSDEITKQALETMRKGFVAQAFEEFKKAKEMSPENLTVLTNFGFVNTLHGNFKDAFDAYAQATILHPEDDVARLGLGNLYWLGGQGEQAIEEWGKLKGRFALDADLSVLKRNEAIWKRMLEIDPLDVDAHSNLGIVYMFAGDMNKALAEFQAVSNLENDRSEHDYYRAQLYVVLYLQTKNKAHRKEAEKILETIAKRSSEFPHSERLQKFVAKL
jgi:tetratricopeptide (TPR) repeat protein